ncbi:Reverse transcriptase ribonuclease h [Mycena kentingensis (nom. inval.)]|nr:Reverse transcriptase ribonuclease h [Mycena kentingensis (nom. inval.)]
MSYRGPGRALGRVVASVVAHYGDRSWRRWRPITAIGAVQRDVEGGGEANFSYPFTPRNDHFSINYFIDSDAFPCTWGTFTCVSLKISLLPPGSQIGIRDISEAYRIVPTHSSQWPGTVVRIPAKLFDLAARPELEGRDDVFAIDSNVAFGEASGGGAYGLVGDAFTDILRARGIGPVSKWVDDSCLFRIRREYLAEHNKVRAELAARMGERKQKGGRLWWGGASLPDGRMEEFDEDFAWPLRDLSDKSERSSDDAQYTYNFADVDSISTPLGMPWKASKDIPFSSSAPFTGLIWDLEKRTVALPDSKKAKYLATIDEWERKRAHNLQEVQSLYGKLLHACLVIPEGRRTLPDWKPPLDSSTIVLFSPDPPPKPSDTTSSGGENDWVLPLFRAPFPVPAQLSTPKPSRTQAPVLASASWSEEGGERGALGRAGSEMAGRSGGPKLSVLSSSSASSSALGSQLATYVCMATTRVSSKDGGTGGVATNTSISAFDESIASVVLLPSPSIHATSSHATTQPTAPPEAFIPPRTYSSHPSTSLSSSKSSSSILTTLAEIVAPSHFQSPRVSTPHNQKTSTGWLSSSTSNKANIQTRSRKTRPRPLPSHLPLAPSSLRPLCFASERLYRWKPARTSSTTTLSPMDAENIRNTLSHAWELGTLETYGSGLLAFHCFCDSRHIPEFERAPATDDVVAAFLATAAGHYAGKTLSNYLAGVRAWHILHRVAWRRNKPECDALVRAAITLQPESSTRKKRQPYTLHVIERLLQQFNPTDSFDAAIIACLLVAFYSCARLGELVVKTLVDFDASKHVTTSSLRDEKGPDGSPVTVVHVPVTKASRSGEDLVFAAQPGLTDPLAALRTHLAINKPPRSAHLFAYVHGASHRPLTKSAFLSRVHKAFGAAKLDPLQGHGIRIGSTLFYLLRGIPFDVVKTIGRWKSDAFLLYLRKHAQVLAPYLQADPQLHTRFLQITMPPVRCELPP